MTEQKQYKRKYVEREIHEGIEQGEEIIRVKMACRVTKNERFHNYINDKVHLLKAYQNMKGQVLQALDELTILEYQLKEDIDKMHEDNIKKI